MISTKLKFTAALILSAATLPALAAAPQFTMTYLGDFTAAAMNNLGDVVGTVGTWGHTEVALYSGGSVRRLGSSAGDTFANGINDAGQIVGRNGEDRAFVYSGGTFNAFGGVGSTAYAINNAGQVVGTQNNNNMSQAFSYSGGVVTALTPNTANTSVAFGINLSGQIAGGASSPNGGPRPVIFANGTVTDLGDTVPWGPINQGAAKDINDHGQVLFTTMDPWKGYNSYVYTNGVATSLRTADSGDVYAQDFNNAGWVVGETQEHKNFVWHDGVMYDLNQIVGNLSGWTIQQAVAINDLNQIAVNACRGTDDHQECGSLLLSIAPVPEPSTYAMMVGGLGLLGFMARRRRATPAAA